MSIDWAYVIRLALQHKVALLLYWHLNSRWPEAVPSARLEELQGYFHTAARRTVFLAGELRRLLQVLDAHHVPAMPYKGPVLAAAAYGPLAHLRQYRDLDVLVQQQDVLRAKDLLVAQGYRPLGQLSGAQEAAYLHSPCAYTYNLRHNAHGVKVELHWHLTPALPLALEPFWDRLVPVALAGATVRSLPPEETLVLQCVYGSDHLWGQLQMLCDVAELIHRHPAMDWERVMAQASTLGSTRMLFVGLGLARDVLGATLPEDVVHRMARDPVAQSLAGQLRARIFHRTSGPPGVVWQYRLREGAQDRVRYCRYAARCYLLTPHPEEQVFLPLPALLSPLYYILRPLRLLGRYVLGCYPRLRRG